MRQAKDSQRKAAQCRMEMRLPNWALPIPGRAGRIGSLAGQSHTHTPDRPDSDGILPTYYRQVHRPSHGPTRANQQSRRHVVRLASMAAIETHGDARLRSKSPEGPREKEGERPPPCGRAFSRPPPAHGPVSAFEVVLRLQERGSSDQVVDGDLLKIAGRFPLIRWDRPVGTRGPTFQGLAVCPFSQWAGWLFGAAQPCDPLQARAVIKRAPWSMRRRPRCRPTPARPWEWMGVLLDVGRRASEDETAPVPRCCVYQPD